MPYHFTVTTETTDWLDLKTLCHIHAIGIWINAEAGNSLHRTRQFLILRFELL